MTLWTLFLVLFSAGTVNQSLIAAVESVEAPHYDYGVELCLAVTAIDERVCTDIASNLLRHHVEPGEIEGVLEEIECKEDAGVAGPSGNPIAVSTIFAVPPN